VVTEERGGKKEKTRRTREGGKKGLHDQKKWAESRILQTAMEKKTEEERGLIVNVKKIKNKSATSCVGQPLQKRCQGLGRGVRERNWGRKKATVVCPLQH